MATKAETLDTLDNLKKYQDEFHAANAQRFEFRCNKTTEQVDREVELARKRLLLCALNLDCDVAKGLVEA